MTTQHNSIDLSRLSRTQLRELADDVSAALEVREHEDRAALEEKLKSLVENAGFNPDDVRFAISGKRRGRKAPHSNGDADHE